MSPYHPLLLLLTLHQCMSSYGEPCGQVIHLARMESEDVLLLVEEEVVIVDISWLFKTKHIATTEPGNPVVIRDPLFLNRLYNGINCSLNITRLTKADQGVYVASIRNQYCSQEYNLTVYSKLSADDIHIEHNVTWSDTCNVILTCAVDKKDAMLTWDNSTDGYVVAASTIHIDSPNATSTWTCRASNPVISAYRTVTPWNLCQKVNKWTIFLYVTVGIILLLLALCILWFSWTKIKLKREASITPTSRYSSPTEGVYWEIDSTREFMKPDLRRVSPESVYVRVNYVQH